MSHRPWSERARILNNLTLLKGKKSEPSNGNVVNDVTSNHGYPINGVWQERITFALIKLNKVSTRLEIYNKMTLYEGSLEDNASGNKNSVAATLSRISSQEDGAYRKHEDSGKLFYGLKEWFNNDGSVKEQYK